MLTVASVTAGWNLFLRIAANRSEAGSHTLVAGSLTQKKKFKRLKTQLGELKKKSHEASGTFHVPTGQLLHGHEML